MARNDNMAGETRIHFLNVGHGDCTVIKHPSGRITVIDTSNAEEVDKAVIDRKLGIDVRKQLIYRQYRESGLSERRALAKAGVTLELTNPVEFIKKAYPGQSIFRYIQTHPEMDHMRGLEAIRDRIGITNFWDTKNHRNCSTSESDRADWEAYQQLRTSDKVKHFTRGDRRIYFGADDEAGNGVGDSLEILSPSDALLKDCDSGEDAGDWNNMSFVIRLTHGPITAIFGGDAGTRAWNDILATYPDKLKCSILKASHHGRESGYVPHALDAMKPFISALSIGEDCEHEAYEQYKSYSKHVWSTYERGDITLTLDGTSTIGHSFSRPV